MLFRSSDDNILVQTVETLGRLPDPWWRSFEDRALYFEDGEIKGYEVEEWLKSVLTFFQRLLLGGNCAQRQT